MPLWEFSNRLTTLWLFVVQGDHDYELSHKVEEQNEEDLLAVEAPLASPLADKLARDEYHNSIVCRTIIAAARGGHLKRLALHDYIQKPFAVRALLPFWLQLDQAYSFPDPEYPEEWPAAAQALRLLFAHTSYSLQRESRSDRFLTPQDVQSMLARFKESKGQRWITRAHPEDFRYIERYT